MKKLLETFLAKSAFAMLACKVKHVIIKFSELYFHPILEADHSLVLKLGIVLLQKILLSVVHLSPLMECFFYYLKPLAPCIPSGNSSFGSYFSLLKNIWIFYYKATYYKYSFYPVRRQRGRVVRAPDLKSVGRGFKSRSDH